MTFHSNPSIETAFAHPRWAAANEAAIGRVMRERERAAGHEPALPKSQAMGERLSGKIEPEHQALFDQLVAQKPGVQSAFFIMRRAGSRIGEKKLYQLLREARARD